MENGLTIQKRYDYWLVVWFYNDDTELHTPTCFGVGVDPKEWADYVLIQKKNQCALLENGRLQVCKGYRLVKLPCEYPDNENNSK